MRLIFMGNPAISVPSLSVLINSSHEVVGVVSNPPKPMGRGRKLMETDVGKKAREQRLNLIYAHNLADSQFLSTLSALKADLFIVVAFRILPKSILHIPHRGIINLHTSLLPRYRGAAPIQRSIMNGDKDTGLTTFFIKPKVDTGEILFQKSVEISGQDDYGSLSDKMATIGATLILHTINQLADGNVTPLEQNDELATSAPKISKEECMINWSNSAEKIHNLIRGLSPLPAAYTFVKGKRIKLYRTEIVSDIHYGKPGTVLSRTGGELIVHSGNGGLRILDVQLEGKRRMLIKDCLQGLKLDGGDQFG